MCEPTTLLTIGSMVMGAYGTYQQGQAQAEAAEYNAEVQEQNAKLKDAQAKDAIARGDAEARQHRLRVSGRVASQRSALAGAGIELDSGSALAVQEDTAAAGAAEVADIEANARREAFGYRTGAFNSRADSALSEANAANTRTGTMITMGSDFMSAGASNMRSGRTFFGGTKKAPSPSYGKSIRGRR